MKTGVGLIANSCFYLENDNLSLYSSSGYTLFNIGIEARLYVSKAY